MKQVSINIPENTYTLTDADINLIHAMALYFSSVERERTGMTTMAYKLATKMEEQFRMHEVMGSFEVWE